MLTNWAGNLTYGAARVHRPGSVAELQEVVAAAERLRPLGSRHSFNEIADTDGDLVSTLDLPREVDLDPDARTVRVSAGTLYGHLATALHEGGWALANTASLPHISVAGAVATGTHGSGDRNRSLAAAVAGLELVGPDGELRRLGRGDPDFEGYVVSLGALGVATAVTLDIEPTYDVRQTVYVDLPWEVLDERAEELTGSAYSVSLFTDWAAGSIAQVWLKSREGEPRPDLFGARPAAGTVHMLAGAATEAVTGQGGVPGPWHERLPHFRLEHTPSRGEELQSEFLVPRARLAEAAAELRRLAPGFADLLQVSEVRTVAADDLWLSPAYGADVVGLHFTWYRDTEALTRVLPPIEAALLPLGARPHWGKCFLAGHDDLAGLYPRLEDFRALRRRVDPTGKLDNAWLERVLGPHAP